MARKLCQFHQDQRCRNKNLWRSRLKKWKELLPSLLKSKFQREETLRKTLLNPLLCLLSGKTSLQIKMVMISLSQLLSLLPQFLRSLEETRILRIAILKRLRILHLRSKAIPLSSLMARSWTWTLMLTAKKLTALGIPTMRSMLKMEKMLTLRREEIEFNHLS